MISNNNNDNKAYLMVSCSSYMSPEYAVDGRFSMKSDVFSIGVLMLEILSAMKIRKFFHPNHHHKLLGHVSGKLSLSPFWWIMYLNCNCSRHGCCGRRAGPWNYRIHVWRIHIQDLKS